MADNHYSVSIKQRIFLQWKLQVRNNKAGYILHCFLQEFKLK